MQPAAILEPKHRPQLLRAKTDLTPVTTGLVVVLRISLGADRRQHGAHLAEA